MAVAGMGLLWAQRMVGGNGKEAVFDREVYVDLETPRILPMRLQRSKRCLSGHKRFAPIRTGRCANETTVGDLFALGREAAGGRAVALEIHGHAILLGTWCPCGRRSVQPGTAWRPPPTCAGCGSTMRRLPDTALERFNEAQARALGILDTTAADLGLPERGALLYAKADGRPPIQLLLA